MDQSMAHGSINGTWIYPQQTAALLHPQIIQLGRDSSFQLTKLTIIIKASINLYKIDENKHKSVNQMHRLRKASCNSEPGVRLKHQLFLQD